MSWLTNKIRNICTEMIKVHGVSCFIAANKVPRTDQETTEFTIDPPTDGDPDGFHVISDDSRFIRIPDGLAGMYIVHAWVYWQGNEGARAWTADDSQAGGFHTFVMRKDSDGQPLGRSHDTAAAVPRMDETHHHILWEGQLNSGDTVEVFCQQNVIDHDEIGNAVRVQAQGILTLRRLGTRA